MEEKIKAFKDIGLDLFAKRKRLSKNKKKALSEEKMAAVHEEWMQMYEQLTEFKEKHGHSLPPRNPRTTLLRWVEKQRTDYKKLLAGKRTDMTTFRVRYLNAIQFPFLSTVQNVSWDDRYEEVKMYKAKYGNISVPESYPGKMYCTVLVDTRLFLLIVLVTGTLTQFYFASSGTQLSIFEYRCTR